MGGESSLPGSYAPQDGVKEVNVCSLLMRDSQGDYRIEERTGGWEKV